MWIANLVAIVRWCVAVGPPKRNLLTGYSLFSNLVVLLMRNKLMTK